MKARWKVIWRREGDGAGNRTRDFDDEESARTFAESVLPASGATNVTLRELPRREESHED